MEQGHDEELVRVLQLDHDVGLEPDHGVEVPVQDHDVELAHDLQQDHDLEPVLDHDVVVPELRYDEVQQDLDCEGQRRLL